MYAYDLSPHVAFIKFKIKAVEVKGNEPFREHKKHQ